MNTTPGYLLGMALQSIAEPRKVARELMDLDYPRQTLWQALALMLVASTFLAVVSGVIFPISPEFEGTIFAMPLVAGVAEMAVTVISVFLIYWVARTAGGTGRFKDGIVTLIWVNFVLLLVQAGVLILSLIAPGLAAILMLAGAFAGIWLLGNFIAEAHGFASVAKVILGIILTSVAVVISVVFTLLGFAVAFGTGDLPNV